MNAIYQPNLKHLKPIFFGTRCLKRVNKKLGVQLDSGDVKVLYFLLCTGPRTEKELGCLNSWNRIKHFIIPKLFRYGYIEAIDKKRLKITIDGNAYLNTFNRMLKNAKFRKDKLGFDYVI